MGKFVARNMLGWFKKINKPQSCCILLVAYIAVPVMHDHTNIMQEEFSFETLRIFPPDCTMFISEDTIFYRILLFLNV